PNLAVMRQPGHSEGAIVFQFRRRRWGWFFLAFFLPVVVGAGLSIWRPYVRQQKALRMIESLGGHLETTTVGPAWFRSQRIISIALAGTKVTDEDMRKLRKLRELRRLSLDETAVSDSGLATLRGTPKEPHVENLEYLSLRGTPTTDREIRFFRKMLPKCEIRE